MHENKEDEFEGYGNYSKNRKNCKPCDPRGAGELRGDPRGAGDIDHNENYKFGYGPNLNEEDEPYSAMNGYGPKKRKYRRDYYQEPKEYIRFEKRRSNRERGPNRWNRFVSRRTAGTGKCPDFKELAKEYRRLTNK